MFKRGLFFAIFFILVGIVSAKDYYIAPTGSDSGTGSITAPWLSLNYAFTKLRPGDNLYLRGGTYYESGITTSLDGNSSNPITIQSYPEEHAIIDGGVPYFKTTKSSEWELVDPSINLYRSKRTFSGSFVVLSKIM